MIQLALIKLSNCRNMLRGFSPETALRYIQNAMGYYSVIENFLKKHPEKEAAVKAVLKDMEELSRKCKSKEEFLDMLESYRVKRNEKDMCIEEKKAASRVFFYTYHGAKGLQFDEVLLLSVNETVTPSKKAVREEEEDYEKNNMRCSGGLLLCHSLCGSKGFRR